MGKREIAIAQGRAGQVRQLPSGRWQARFSYAVISDRRPVQPRVTYDTEADAWRAIREAISEYERGELVFETDEGEGDLPDEEDRSVAAVTRAYIDANRHELQPSTVRGYESDRNRTVCHPEWGIGHKDVDTLTAGEIARWRQGLTEPDRVTPHMAAGGFRFLRAALSWLVETDDDFLANPALGLTTRKRQKTKKKTATKRITMPTWDQQMTFIRSIPDEGDRLLALLLLWAGPRFSEAASIQPGKVHVTPTPTVELESVWKRGLERATRTRSKGYTVDAPVWEAGPLKTGEPRDLFLPTPLAERIVDWRDNRRRPPRRGRAQVLFPFHPASGSRTGFGVWEPSSYRRVVLLPARELAGLPALRIKDFRAIAASLLHDSGFSDAQVQEALGHAEGSQVTMKNYVKPVRDVHNPDRERIRTNPRWTPQQRLDKLWAAWVKGTGQNPFR